MKSSSYRPSALCIRILSQHIQTDQLTLTFRDLAGHSEYALTVHKEALSNGRYAIFHYRTSEKEPGDEVSYTFSSPEHFDARDQDFEIRLSVQGIVFSPRIGSEDIVFSDAFADMRLTALERPDPATLSIRFSGTPRISDYDYGANGEIRVLKSAFLSHDHDLFHDVRVRVPDLILQQVEKEGGEAVYTVTSIACTLRDSLTPGMFRLYGEAPGVDRSLVRVERLDGHAMKLFFDESLTGTEEVFIEAGPEVTTADRPLFVSAVFPVTRLDPIKAERSGTHYTVTSLVELVHGRSTEHTRLDLEAEGLETFSFEALDANTLRLAATFADTGKTGEISGRLTLTGITDIYGRPLSDTLFYGVSRDEKALARAPAALPGPSPRRPAAAAVSTNEAALALAGSDLSSTLTGLMKSAGPAVIQSVAKNFLAAAFNHDENLVKQVYDTFGDYTYRLETIQQSLDTLNLKVDAVIEKVNAISSEMKSMEARRTLSDFHILLDETDTIYQSAVREKYFALLSLEAGLEGEALRAKRATGEYLAAKQAFMEAMQGCATLLIANIARISAFIAGPGGFTDSVVSHFTYLCRERYNWAYESMTIRAAFVLKAAACTGGAAKALSLYYTLSGNTYGRAILKTKMATITEALTGDGSLSPQTAAAPGGMTAAIQAIKTEWESGKAYNYVDKNIYRTTLANIVSTWTVNGNAAIGAAHNSTREGLSEFCRMLGIGLGNPVSTARFYAASGQIRSEWRTRANDETWLKTMGARARAMGYQGLLDELETIGFTSTDGLIKPFNTSAWLSFPNSEGTHPYLYKSGDEGLKRQYNTASAFLVKPSHAGWRGGFLRDDFLIQARVLFSGGKTLSNSVEGNAEDTFVDNALLAYLEQEFHSYKVNAIHAEGGRELVNTLYMFVMDNAGTAP